MKQVRLTRVAASPDEGTFGTWVLDGKPICLTLEPYHRSNATSISCIPTGQYVMKRYDSPKYGDRTWMVTSVEGRSYILVHGGNVDDNTKGCIVLGENYGSLGYKWAVLNSAQAMREFMYETRDEEELLLTIVECF